MIDTDTIVATVTPSSTFEHSPAAAGLLTLLDRLAKRGFAQANWITLTKVLPLQ
jgi:hypothetical protein